MTNDPAKKFISDINKNIKHDTILSEEDEKILSSSISIIKYLKFVKKNIINLEHDDLINVKENFVPDIFTNLNEYLYEIIIYRIDTEIGKNNNNIGHDEKKVGMLSVLIKMLENPINDEYIDAFYKYIKFNYAKLLSTLEKKNLTEAEKKTIKIFIRVHELGINVGLVVGFRVYILAIICLIVLSVILFFLFVTGLAPLAIIISIVWFVWGYNIYRGKSIDRNIKMLLICISLGPLTYFV